MLCVTCVISYGAASHSLPSPNCLTRSAPIIIRQTQLEISFTWLRDMRDPYDLKKASKKKSSTASKLDEDAAKEAEKVREGTYRRARAARKRLQAAEVQQRGTTDETKKQNEKLDNVMKGTHRTLEQTEEAKKKATDLQYAANAFDIFAPTKAACAKWKNEKSTAEPESKESEISEEEISAEAASEKEKEASGEKDEDDKTAEELRKMYKTVKHMKKETKIQSREGRKQKSKLKKLLKTQKKATAGADEAEERLKKI